MPRFLRTFNANYNLKNRNYVPTDFVIVVTTLVILFCEFWRQ